MTGTPGDRVHLLEQLRTRVQFLAANAVRVTHGPPGDGPFPPDRPWLDHMLLPAPEVAPEQARLDVALRNGCVHARTREGEPVLAEARPPRLAADGRVRLALRTSPGEGFYGWGERFHNLS